MHVLIVLVVLVMVLRVWAMGLGEYPSEPKPRRAITVQERFWLCVLLGFCAPIDIYLWFYMR